MAIAAVPAYLGKNFREASPGMRFGFLLPIWTTRSDQENEVNKRAEAKSREGDEVRQLRREGMDVAIRELCRRQRNPLPGLWDKNDFAARNAWKEITALTPADKMQMEALSARQLALSSMMPTDRILVLPAQSTAPFTTGLGNEHPLENGFAFLNPYGLPYLPGSGIKGVLRQAARQLADSEWGETRGWTADKRYPLTVQQGQQRRPVLDAGNNPVMLSVLDVLFGYETDAGETTHVRGALSFWDVIPQIKGNNLTVDIMTPHQGHYYQKGETPHESGQPIPVSYLTIPPGSGFSFHVVCDLAHLTRLAPELAANQTWKTLLQHAFTHAFQWLGFGAKTAVGYGAMHLDQQAQDKREREIRENRARAERTALEASLTENQKTIRAFIDKCEKRQAELNGRKDKQNTGIHQEASKLVKGATGWSPEEKQALAQAIRQWLPQVIEKVEKDTFRKMGISALEQP